MSTKFYVKIIIRSKVMKILAKSVKNATEQRQKMLMRHGMLAGQSRRDSFWIIWMALKRAVYCCEEQLAQLMFKVAAVCIDTCPESLPEGKDGLVDWLLRQISPDDFQHRLEFRLVLGLGLVDPVPFQHCPADVIVKRVEIRRVGRPFVFGDEIWAVLCFFLCCPVTFLKLFARIFITFERIIIFT